MAKKKYGKNYVSKSPVVANGKNIGTTLRYDDGYEKTILNPSGKGTKYATELKMGVGFTNDGEPKTDDDGLVKTLTKEQRAYRSGYLQAQSDNAKAYKSKRK